MSVQADLPFPSKKFVMFLTLHCSYDGKEFENFQRHPLNQDINAYMQPTLSMTKGNKAPYWVKAFVYHNLTQFFTINHFVPEFLPVIYYKGDNNHPLLFFTVIGTQIPSASGVAIPFQKISDVLYGKFVSINEENLLVHNEELTVHAEKCKEWGMINSLYLFKQSTTYKRHWKA